jgi:hypothetical protein
MWTSGCETACVAKKNKLQVEEDSGCKSLPKLAKSHDGQAGMWTEAYIASKALQQTGDKNSNIRPGEIQPLRANHLCLDWRWYNL